MYKSCNEKFYGLYLKIMAGFGLVGSTKNCPT
jgi:hypothetical protein